MDLKIKQKFRLGVVLAELIIAIAVSVIPISLVAVLLYSGHCNWGQTYVAANRQIEIDGQNAVTVFGRIGRKSDRTNTLIDSVTETTAGSIFGEAVEFRYWADKPLKRAFGSKTGASEPANEYARFYLDNNKLKIDYGPYPYKGARRISRTFILADNAADVLFSRTVANNCRQASVSMELKLVDPDDGKEFVVKTAALMRN